MKATLKQGIDLLMMEYEKLTDNTIQVIHIGKADRDTILKEKSLPQMKLITGKNNVLQKVLIREKYVPFRKLSISDSIEFSVKNKRSIYNYINEDG